MYIMFDGAIRHAMLDVPCRHSIGSDGCKIDLITQPLSLPPEEPN